MHASHAEANQRCYIVRVSPYAMSADDVRPEQSDLFQIRDGGQSIFSAAQFRFKRVRSLPDRGNRVAFNGNAAIFDYAVFRIHRYHCAAANQKIHGVLSRTVFTMLQTAR